MNSHSNLYFAEPATLGSGPFEAEAKNYPRLTFAVFIGLIGLNLGATEWISIPVAVLLILLYSIEQVEMHAGLRPLPQFAVLSFLISAPVVFQLIVQYNDVHSALVQCREVAFAALTLFFCGFVHHAAVAILRAFLLSALVISALVILQFLQIRAGMDPLVLPQMWFMLDYGNSVQTALANEWDYLRPVALYSEPSVVASILIPALYISARLRLWPTTLAIATGLVCSGSMLGIMAIAGISLFVLPLSVAQRVFLSLVSILVISQVVGKRLEAIFASSDMSFQWRFLLPIDFLKTKFTEGSYGVTPVSEIFRYAEIYFDSASIGDNWPLYTLARMGVWGIFWISLVFWVLPRPLKILFAYLAIVSGSPLYFDKTLIMIVVIQALYALHSVPNSKFAIPFFKFR